MSKEQFIHINEYDSKYYYSDREMTILHRENGPAVKYSNGYKAYYVNDKRHRENGPAIKWADGTKAWYINGERLTKKEFKARMKARMNPVTELTLDEIASKFGVSVDQLKIKK